MGKEKPRTYSTGPRYHFQDDGEELKSKIFTQLGVGLVGEGGFSALRFSCTAVLNNLKSVY